MEAEFVEGVPDEGEGRKMIKLEHSNLSQGPPTLNAAAAAAGSTCIYPDAGWMHPLEADDILHSLFKFLDKSSLMSSRLVCSKWRNISTKVWVQRSSAAIVVPPSFHDTVENQKKYSEAFESLRGLVSVLQIRNIKIKRLEDIEILQSMDFLGSEIRGLDFKPPSPSSHVQYTEMMMTDYLCGLLEFLPNLKVLTMHHFNFDFVQDNISELLDKLQTLDELRLCCPLSSTVLQIPEIGQKLQAIKCLTISEEHAHHFLLLYVSQNIPWRIEQLTLTLTPIVPLHTTRAFFNMVTASLKELNVYYLWDYRQPFIILPDTWVDNWYLPVTLGSLEKLSVCERAQNADTNSMASRRTTSATWRTVATALQLPKLKKLDITSQFAGRLETIVNDWREHRGQVKKDGTRDELSSQSLESLYIVVDDHHWTDSSPFTNRTINFFPNVTNLHLELCLVEPGPTIITAVFARWTQLTTLILTLWPGRNFMSNDFGNVDWNSLFTGLDNKHSSQNCDNDEVTTTTWPSLRNLKNLKFLKIHCSKRNLVSDFLIYNELMHMKNLNTVLLTGAKFSPKALKDLAHALGPDVNIQTDNTKK